jgi:hypothetical protein
MSSLSFGNSLNEGHFINIMIPLHNYNSMKRVFQWIITNLGVTPTATVNGLTGELRAAVGASTAADLVPFEDCCRSAFGGKCCDVRGKWTV